MVMGRPANSEQGRGTPQSLWLSPQANQMMRETAARDKLSLSKAASNLIETSNQEMASTLARQEEAIKNLTTESEEKDSIIQQLKKAVEDLEQSQARSRRVVGVDLSRVHPLHRDLVAKAMEKK